MPAPDTTTVRANEPSSAPPEFLWEGLPGIHQYKVSAAGTGAPYSGDWVAQNATALGLEPQSQDYSEATSANVFTTFRASSEPPVFFLESSNLDRKYTIRSVFGGSGYQTFLVGAETSIVKSGFAANEWELSQQYGEVKDALRELATLEEEDDWRIEESVFAAASYYATKLRAGSIPAPQILVHGPKSVVFNWSSGYYDLDLTISANTVSALLSSPGRIIRRAEYSKNQLSSPLALLYFGSENTLALNSDSGSILRESSRR